MFLLGALICEISIHAPREGSDAREARISELTVQFLSTLPVRGATHHGVAGHHGGTISIHAPREGSDNELFGGDTHDCYFYPRSP